ncbi:ABC transporter ATP-binding protein [Gorillibacterium timonense]|uniref:ABC transporter ATP-binding protein n=1 Tax=Gorillibacterium timonense TaxID=1689269 RepID=UPI00071E4328|nr:ABC transporter ATP-binding protein [Gorillibacterium timonense]
MNPVKIPLSRYLRLLSGYLKPQWKSVALLYGLLIASIAMQLVNPQIIRHFIDSAQAKAEVRELYYAGALFIGISLIYQLMILITTYLSENVGWTATNRLREDVAEHCLRLDPSFHKAHSSGMLIERVDGDINALSNFFSKLSVMLLSNLALVIGILILLFREGWQIGLVMLVFVGAAISALQYVRRYTAPLWTKVRAISAEFFGFLGEHLEGTEDARANGAAGFVMNRFHRIMRRWFPLRFKAFMGFASMWITSLILFAFGTAMAFAVSASLYRHGAITLGTVYMIIYYTEQLSRPIEQIRTQMEDLQKADASITRIGELLATESTIKDGTGSPPEAGPSTVRFDQVVFGYEEDLVTLNHIDFTLERGKSLGVLGRTGSGKTTLARLLLRFHDPREGVVTLDGRDLREFRVEDLRRHVGMVTQQIELFQGTVRDNLTFYNEAIPDSRIEDILRELGMEEWLASMPRGLDTPLSSNGGGLSAGEAQLLAFARVFLSDPGVVILDEASSKLDPATEQKIVRAIDRLVRERTCIIIAHRLATVRRVDDILILEDGHMIEHGPRQALADDPGSRFSHILSTGEEELSE